MTGEPRTLKLAAAVAHVGGYVSLRRHQKSDDIIRGELAGVGHLDLEAPMPARRHVNLVRLCSEHDQSALGLKRDRTVEMYRGPMQSE